MKAVSAHLRKDQGVACLIFFPSNDLDEYSWNKVIIFTLYVRISSLVECLCSQSIVGLSSFPSFLTFYL